MRIDEGIQAKQIVLNNKGEGKEKKLKFFEKKLSRQKKRTKRWTFMFFTFFFFLGDVKYGIQTSTKKQKNKKK